VDQYFDEGNVLLSRYYLYRGKIIKNMRANKVIQGMDSVLFHFEMAQNIVERHGGNPIELAKVKYELAMYAVQLGETKRAESYFKELLMLIDNHFDLLDYFRAMYLYRIGIFYQNNGDLERSALCLNLAIDIFKHPSNKDKNNWLRAEIALANTLFYIDEQSGEALQHYKSAVELSYQLKSDNNRTLVMAYTNASTVLYRTNLFDSCIYISSQAIAINRKERVQDKLLLSSAHLNLGLAQNQNKMIGDAQINFDIAEKMFLQTVGEKDYYTHVLYRTLGEECEKKENYRKALDYYQKALISLYTEFHSMDVYENPSFSSKGNKEEVLYAGGEDLSGFE
jgi:tetratricopeptide (TPR) repeat protein